MVSFAAAQLVGKCSSLASDQRPAARRPMSIVSKPLLLQFMTKTLKPCSIHISMSLGLAG